MFSRDDIDDYFMKPYYLDGVGYIYPVNIFEYNRFKILANKYITQGITTLHNLYKIDKNANVYDYFVHLSIESQSEYNGLIALKNYIPQNEKEKDEIEEINKIMSKIKDGELMFYLISEMEELFKIVLKEDVKFDYTDKCFYIGGRTSSINKDNFEHIREVIMWMNMLFEIPTSPSRIGNKQIQRAIQSEFRNCEESSLASICSVVSCNSGVGDDELKSYSYYRLMYDFSIINKQHGNMFVFMLRSQGCSDVNINNLSGTLDLHKNPYDCLFKKFTNNKGNF